MEKLQAPVVYQGGKTTLAKSIIDVVNPPQESHFYDLCAGSGAITLELLSRGFKPENIAMYDLGTMIRFWQAVGAGTFDLDYFKSLCKPIQEDLPSAHIRMLEIVSNPIADEFLPYAILLLQAASFGGKQVTYDNGVWKHHGFRKYIKRLSKGKEYYDPAFKPTLPSLLNRVEKILPVAKGLQAYQQDIQTISFKPNSIIYLDPPYTGTTGYKYTLDITRCIKQFSLPFYISDSVPHGATCINLSEHIQERGRLTGTATISRTEYLSIFK